MSRLVAQLRRHPLLVIGVSIALFGAIVLGREAWTTATLPDNEVDMAAPDAERLDAEGDQGLYRIDPTASTATYTVEERLAGASTTATGTTQGIAGDIVIDLNDPSESSLGQIVVNLEQLTSDSNLRDRRIRHEFLESETYRFATFDTDEILGLPAAIDPGSSHDIELVGQLTVKETTAPVTWEATVALSEDAETLTATATTTVQMSTFDVGPISIMGLVTTGNDLTLTLDLTAPRVHDDSATPDDIDLPAAEIELVDARPGDISFSDQILPLVETHCASCHVAGGIGSLDVPLDTVRDVAQIAEDLALVTGSGYMPPWPASDESIDFLHPRGMSDAEIALIAEWAEQGGPIDLDPETEFSIPDPDISEPRRDLSLQPDSPYAHDGGEKDDYRCFVLDPGFDETTFITGFSFEPGTREVVHHGQVFLIPGDGRSEADALDGSDGQIGWECNVGTEISAQPGLANGGLSGLIGGWVPGQRPFDFEQYRVGFEIQPDDFFVVQLHYHYEHEYPEDLSTLHLQTSTDDDIRPIQVLRPLAPVEIPCPDGLDGPLCDRDAALAEIGRLYGRIAQFVPDSLLDRCGQTPEDYASYTDGTGYSECTHTLGDDADGWIVDVFGHMHELGAAFRLTLHPGTPQETVLLDIPTWSFNWQLNYQPAEPVRVEPGDELLVECWFDRSLRYDPEPKYLAFAEGTVDEMCYSAITVLPGDDPPAAPTE